MKYVLAIFVFLLSACGSLTSAETINQKLVYAINTADAVTVSTAELYKSDVINRDQAIYVTEALDKVYNLLNAVKVAKTINDSKTALDKLNQANMILKDLQNKLQGANNAKPKPSQSSIWNGFHYCGVDEYCKFA